MVRIADWQDGPIDPKFKLLRLTADFPRTFVEFGYPLEKGSRDSFLLFKPPTKDNPLKEYILFTPNVWTHICLSYDKPTTKIIIVKVPFLYSYSFEIWFKLNEIEDLLFFKFAVR